MIEKIEIIKLDNGYCVVGETTKSSGHRAHYCSNLKGVTAELYRIFEGITKVNKDQLSFLQELKAKRSKDGK